ncbi:hypothetical protein [Clostridium perfringens]|uniref:hypothetical protein n=1 Tax=Clostridium perfringens TaxID=1502 RepID=UPI001E443009|nr:hypothetical protein [Clostridium perfringens]MCC5421385.1 hypothetical protein [Clostridium perfringens]MCC5430809.1 hypothetical protein [Clostridium perfringens]MCC5445315.1 hypothetical protein [Clostridium perfringens]MCC5448256.1 hypothetical protein [Clostridium perfringens]WVL77731.1 hypothetical protein LMS42_004835 [Clostridium perfringens]
MDMLSKAIEMNGKKAIITNNNAEVVIKPISDSYKDGVNFNYLYTYAPIQNGNVVNIDNINYIVLEKDENLVNTYNKVTITKAQIIIYKEKQLLGYVRALKDVVENNQYFKVLADEIEITIPYMSDISIGDDVSYNNKNFKIQSIDDTKENLLVLISKYDTTASDGVNNQDKPIEPTESPKEEPKPVEPPKEEGEDFSGTFKIDGLDKLQKGTTSTYTLSPARKTVKWFIDDKYKASVEIVSEEEGSITLKNIAEKMNVVKIVAKSPDDKELCNKGILVY